METPAFWLADLFTVTAIAGGLRQSEAWSENQKVFQYSCRFLGCLISSSCFLSFTPLLLFKSPLVIYHRRTSTGSESFSLLVCLDLTTFALLIVFTLLETIGRKLLQNHCLRIQNVCLRLTCKNVFAEAPYCPTICPCYNCVGCSWKEVYLYPKTFIVHRATDVDE